MRSAARTERASVAGPHTGDERMVEVGHISGAYGVAGWVKVEPYTQMPDSLAALGEWWIGSDDASWRRATVLEARVHGASVIARIAEVDDRDAALAIKGRVVAVPRSVLPRAAEGEIYWADLVGLTVVNRDGRTLGRVSGVTEHGAHPILQVRSDDGTKERLIPYVPALIDALDLAGGRIEVDWGEDY